VAYLGGVMAVPEEFCFALSQLMLYSTEAMCDGTTFIHLDRVKYSDHGPARNSLARDFLGDWLLQLDTDHQPEPDLLVRMVTSMNAIPCDVLTALYRFKKPPYSPVLWGKSDKRGIAAIGRWPKNAVFQISRSGAGALLARRSVFDRIRSELGCEPFERLGGGHSEDHSFFTRLEQLGIDAYCDSRIESPHLVVSHVPPQDDEGLLIETSDLKGTERG
jgi:hypothetical protein